jgi:hypothetical protein
MPIAPGNILTLNWTNPGLKPALTVDPGTTNTSSTSLTLMGQGYPGWAVPLQENIMKLLENFASWAAPPNPTVGQLWYDTSVVGGRLYVCVDPVGPPIWREIITSSEIFVSPGTPTGVSVGNLWFNPSTSILSVCNQTTPTETWTTILTWDLVVRTTAPPFPRVNGQLWYDTTNRVLFSWDSTLNDWERVAPNSDLDIIAGSGWNEIIPDINKILGPPTTTLDIGDPFTDLNAWGFNQTITYGPYYSDVPAAQWLDMYNTIFKIGTVLGISVSGLVIQDFHIPGSSGNQYGVPFMLDQWDLIKAKIEEFKTNHLDVDGAAKDNSGNLVRYVGTGDGTVTGITSPDPSGYSVAEQWVLTATSATNFTVTGSVSGAQAAATVGTPYDNGIIAFTINAGGIAFVAADEFAIDVLPNLKSTYATTWGAGATGLTTEFNFAFNDLNHIRGFFNAGGALTFTTTFDDTTTNHNSFWNQFLTDVGPISMNYRNCSYNLGSYVDQIGYYDLTSTYQTIMEVDSRIMTPGVIRNFGYAAPFVCTTPVADPGNTGDGTMGTMSAIDQDPLTSVVETWTVTCTDATLPATFAVVGSVSGALADATAGVAYTNAHVGFTITAGGTAFIVGDSFTFDTTGVLNYIRVEAKTANGGNDVRIKLTVMDSYVGGSDTVTVTGANDGLVTQVTMLRVSRNVLDNPEMPYPNVTTTAWA